MCTADSALSLSPRHPSLRHPSLYARFHTARGTLVGRLELCRAAKSGLHSQGLEQLAHSLSWFRATLRNFDRFDGCLPDSIFGSAIGLQTAY